MKNIDLEIDIISLKMRLSKTLRSHNRRTDTGQFIGPSLYQVGPKNGYFEN